MSGLIPCPLAAWTRTRTPWNAADRCGMTYRAHPARSVAGRSAGCSIPLMSSATQHRGSSRNVAPSPCSSPRTCCFLSESSNSPRTAPGRPSMPSPSNSGSRSVRLGCSRAGRARHEVGSHEPGACADRLHTPAELRAGTRARSRNVSVGGARSNASTEEEQRLASDAMEWLRRQRDEPKADRPAVKQKRKGRT